MFKLPLKLYGPEDELSGGGPQSLESPQDKDDVIDFLGDDDEPPTEDDDKLDLTDTNKGDDKKKEKATDDDSDDKEEDEGDKEGEEEDELDELIEDLDEPDEEKLEIVTPVRRKEILKKYPDLFKDFPYLEKAYYREQQFTEVFPTIDEAKEARSKGETLDNFERDLVSGNITTILKAVNDQDKNSFYRIADNYLQSLAQVDEKAYLHVLGNTLKHTCSSMAAEAKRTNNEALMSAAQLLYQFGFGTSEFEAPKNLAREDTRPDEKTTEFEERQRAFTQQQYESTRNDLNTKVDNALTRTITENIDPKGSMSDYVKASAIREASETLNGLLTNDKRFRDVTDRLWKHAFQSNFSQESVNRIRSAYLSKAKTLLPSVIKKARNNALRGMGKRVRETTKKTEQPRSSERRTSGKSTKDIPADVGTLEFLNQGD